MSEPKPCTHNHFYNDCCRQCGLHYYKCIKDYRAENERLKEEAFVLERDLGVARVENGPIRPFMCQQIEDLKAKLEKAERIIKKTATTELNPNSFGFVKAAQEYVKGLGE